VFPNEKYNLSLGWQAAQKTEGQADGLQKRVGRAAKKGSSPARLFCSPAYCAANWPIL